MIEKELVLHKQNLLVISVILIIFGAIIWLVPWPPAAEPATNIIGQIMFWVGIALFILWIALVGYYEATSKESK